VTIDPNATVDSSLTEAKAKKLQANAVRNLLADHMAALIRAAGFAIEDKSDECREFIQSLQQLAKTHGALKMLDSKIKVSDFLPHITDQTVQLSGVSFPVELSYMSKKAGLAETIEFLNDARKTLEPLVLSSIKSQFNKRFPDLDSSIVGKIFETSAGFTFKLIKLDQDKQQCVLKEVMFKDITNTYEELDFEEVVSISVFRKDFKLQ
jgi:hypothetical protein